MTPALEKLHSIAEGGCRVFSDEELDDLVDSPEINRLRTCINKQQTGVRDRYLGWIDERSAPADLEFKPDGFAYGTHWGNKPRRPLDYNL